MKIIMRSSTKYNLRMYWKRQSNNLNLNSLTYFVDELVKVFLKIVLRGDDTQQQ
jgi:hypothetical protein